MDKMSWGSFIVGAALGAAAVKFWPKSKTNPPTCEPGCVMGQTISGIDPYYQLAGFQGVDPYYQLSAMRPMRRRY